MVSTIFKELLVNACIMVTVVFIGSQFFMNTGLNSRSSVWVKIQGGIVSGILGIILMIFSIPIPPKGLIDLRQISIMISAIYGGWTSTFVAGTILALFRLLYKGVNYVSIVATLTLLATMVTNILISKSQDNKKKKWIYVFFASCTISIIGFCLTVGKSQKLLEIVVAYILGLIFASIVAYFLIEYLARNYNLVKRLREESTLDYLTGLHNTRSFDELYNSAIEDSRSKNSGLSLLILDIDFFKKVNDNYGHNNGDVVLKELGEIFAKSVRNIDTVARVGGEEFGILLRDCSVNTTLVIAERIRETVEGHIFNLPDGRQLRITISIGGAVYPDTVLEIEGLKEEADIKLYQAKRTGRNKVCI